MRKALICSVVVVLCAAGLAFGADRSTPRDKEMAQFAKDVATKIVYRPGAEIAVSARDCRLHIEFSSLRAAFDLPMEGTTAAATEAEDGIVVNNRAMTRTIGSRAPEPFQNLILSMSRHDVAPILASFQHAVASCSASRASVVASR